MQQEPLLSNPTRNIVGGILRNAPLVQTPQSKLVNREECGTQAQLRSDQDRVMATLADPYLTWQGVPHLMTQVEAPGFPDTGLPGPPRPPSGGPSAPLASHEEFFQVPLVYLDHQVEAP